MNSEYNVQDWINMISDENEKPLDRMVTDGGFCGIFRTIGCVGDSLSSGEFEAYDEEGTKRYLDMYDYSWGQYLARMAGCKVYNFSKGGMTAKQYMESFAESRDFWNPEKACQAYIIALGVNDVVNNRQALGSISDICAEDPSKNAHTFAGYYAMIIQRLKTIQPDAKFFFMTMPRQDNDSPEVVAIRDAHAALLKEFANYFSNSYVLDIRKYGPVYDTAFRKRFYMGGHLNAAGYVLTSHIVASYLDYIIRHNFTDFKEVSLMGTPYRSNR